MRASPVPPSKAVEETPPTTLARSRELDKALKRVQVEIDSRKRLRLRLTLLERPIATLGHFGAVMGGWVLRTLPYVAAAALAVGSLLGARHHVSAEARAGIDSIIFGLMFMSWWFGLGVLQTVGFGSGLQSGVMFMLPHVIRTAVVAGTCNHLDFHSMGEMWWSKDPMLFACSPDSNSSSSTSTAVPLFALFLRLIPSGMLFQMGATCGEVPPYFMSYTAAEAGRINALVDAVDPNDSTDGSDGDDEWIECLLDPNRAPKQKPKRAPRLALDAQIANTTGSSSSSNSGEESGWESAKRRMEDFITRHGFVAIWALATFPSGAFDLCGVCCGQLRVPFKVFFGATLLGKVCFRAPIQVVGIVFAVRESTSSLLLAWVQSACNALGVPRDWRVVQRLTDQLHHFRNAAAASAAASSMDSQLGDQSSSSIESSGSSGGSGWAGVVWNGLVGCLMLFFVMGTIQEVARQRAARLDQDMIQALRDSVGLPEDAFPHLHLSPALRSPKARDALRQPLFASPTPRSSHRKWNNKPTPNSGQTATTSTTRKHRNPDQGSHAAESTPETTGQQKGSSGARRRKGGPVPEKLDLFGE